MFEVARGRESFFQGIYPGSQFVVLLYLLARAVHQHLASYGTSDHYYSSDRPIHQQRQHPESRREHAHDV
jgi:hypothetical protein